MKNKFHRRTDIEGRHVKKKHVLLDIAEHVEKRTKKAHSLNTIFLNLLREKIARKVLKVFCRFAFPMFNRVFIKFGILLYKNPRHDGCCIL